MRHPRLHVLTLVLLLAPVCARGQEAPQALTAVSSAGGPDAASAGTAATAGTGDDAPAVAIARPAAAAAGVTPPLPSVASLFTRIPDDLRQTARVENAAIIVTAGAAAALIHPYDARITAHFSTSPTLATVLGPGKVIGGFVVQFGGAWAAYGLGRVIRHERTALVGADLVRAQLVNTIFTQGLKLSVNRMRPDGTNWSFPSGHASGTFANAAVLHRHFGWKVGVPAYAVATYVAASRLQANRHYASDVIVGAGIGLVSGRAVTVGRGRQRFALTPMPVPGGGVGVSFTHID